MDNSELEFTPIEPRKIKKKRTKKKILIIVGVAIIGIIAATGVYACRTSSLVKKYDNKVYPGIKVLEIDIAGLTKEELHNKLEKRVEEFGYKEVEVVVGDEKYERAQRAFSIDTDYESLEKEIIAYGKDKKFFEKLKLIQEPKEQNYDIELAYDEKSIEKFVEEIAKENYVKPINSEIDVTGSKVTIEDGKSGLKVDKVLLTNSIIEAIENTKTLENSKIEPVFTEVNAEITSKELSTVNTKISTFTTYFSAGPRGENIRLGTLNVDNILLMPGDEFSGVKAIGPTTPELGYHESTTFNNGQVTKGYGGGVCQIITTLYNAQLRAGIEPTSRTNHSFAVSYVDEGLDATIGNTIPDLVFKNTLDYPVVINAHIKNGALTVEMWSNSEATEGIKYKPVVVKTGERAFDTYLKGYDKNGKCVINEYLNSSWYLPSVAH